MTSNTHFSRISEQVKITKINCLCLALSVHQHGSDWARSNCNPEIPVLKTHLCLLAQYCDTRRPEGPFDINC